MTAPFASGRTAEIFALENGHVRKIFREEYPHLAQEEYDKVCLLTQMGVAMPHVFGLAQTDGRYGIEYERIDAPSMLQVLQRRPWRLRTLARAMAQVQHELHSKNGSGLPDVCSMLRDRIEHAPLLPQAVRERLSKTLHTLPEGTSVCHMDFHPDNLLVPTDGPPVTIDWMTACCGHPLADVARTCLILRSNALPLATPPLAAAAIGLFRKRLCAAYLQHYVRLSGARVSEMERWLPPLAAARLCEGISAEEPYLLALAGAPLPPCTPPR